MLQHVNEVVLPHLIAVCELIGIFVIVVSVLKAFYQYVKEIFTHKNTHFKVNLAHGLASGLEFEMAGEILKSVLYHRLDELIILGAVILLRAALALMIHFEVKAEEKHADAK